MNTITYMKTYNSKTIEELKLEAKKIWSQNSHLSLHEQRLDKIVESIAEACTPKWISVEEKLPENKMRVLVCRLEYPNKKPNVAIDYCINRNWNLTMCDVTHWMPLPELPK